MAAVGAARLPRPHPRRAAAVGLQLLSCWENYAENFYALLSQFYRSDGIEKSSQI